jgi:hypothetical protein
MSEPIFREGHEFRDDNGNLICRAARDIFPGETLSKDQFKDWQVAEPLVGEMLPPSIAKALLP